MPAVKREGFGLMFQAHGVTAKETQLETGVFVQVVHDVPDSNPGLKSCSDSDSEHDWLCCPNVG